MAKHNKLQRPDKNEIRRRIDKLSLESKILYQRGESDKALRLQYDIMDLYKVLNELQDYNLSGRQFCRVTKLTIIL